MRVTLKIALSTASVALLFPLTIAFAAGAPTEGTCPTGTRIATAGDAIVKNGQIAAGTCYNPNDPNVGQNDEQAKQQLLNMRCGSNVNTQQLDGKFAVCAAKFMTQLRTVDSSACINSAYRDTQQQANACKGICGNTGGCPGKCAPPGKSYHQKGLAIDMKSTVSNQQLWSIGGQSGLTNPSGLHSSDPRHLQANAGTTCAGTGVPATDQGDYYNDTNRYFQSNALPFDNSVRNALGMTPPPPPPPAPIQPPVQTTPITTGATATQTPPPIGAVNTTPYAPGTCSPQTYCSQSDGNVYYRSTQCVDQVYQRCTNGCTGVICNATASTSPQTNAPTSGSILSNLLSSVTTATSAPVGTPAQVFGLGTTTSAFDLIQMFANDASDTIAIPVGTSTFIDFQKSLDGLDGIGTLQPVAPTSSAQASTSASVGGVPSPTVSTLFGATSSSGSTGGNTGVTVSPLQQSPIGSVAPAQTFTSEPLGNNTESAQQSSPVVAVLAQMQAALTSALTQLQPFGGRITVPAWYLR